MDELILDLQDVLYRIQGDKDLLLELVDIFLEDTPQRLDVIKQLLPGTDFPALADAAHSVKGSAGNIGAKKLWRTFKAMEDAAKAQDMAAFQENLGRALAEFREFQNYVPTIKAQLVS